MSAGRRADRAAKGRPICGRRRGRCPTGCDTGPTTSVRRGRAAAGEPVDHHCRAVAGERDRLALFITGPAKAAHRIGSHHQQRSIGNRRVESLPAHAPQRALVDFGRGLRAQDDAGLGMQSHAKVDFVAGDQTAAVCAAIDPRRRSRPPGQQQFRAALWPRRVAIVRPATNASSRIPWPAPAVHEASWQSADRRAAVARAQSSWYGFHKTANDCDVSGGVATVSPPAVSHAQMSADNLGSQVAGVPSATTRPRFMM